MTRNPAFDKESIEKHENIEFVYIHDYNDISVIFNETNITPDLINHVNRNCTETLHICSIYSSGENENMRVSFEF
jgi:hypothetical protein